MGKVVGLSDWNVRWLDEPAFASWVVLRKLLFVASATILFSGVPFAHILYAPTDTLELMKLSSFGGALAASAVSVIFLAFAFVQMLIQGRNAAYYSLSFWYLKRTLGTAITCLSIGLAFMGAIWVTQTYH